MVDYHCSKRQRKEGGRGVPFQFQQRPVDPADCARRELKHQALSFFLEVFSESFKMVDKGESKPKSKECLPDPRILSVFCIFAERGIVNLPSVSEVCVKKFRQNIYEAIKAFGAGHKAYLEVDFQNRR